MNANLYAKLHHLQEEEPPRMPMRSDYANAPGAKLTGAQEHQYNQAYAQWMDQTGRKPTAPAPMGTISQGEVTYKTADGKKVKTDDPAQIEALRNSGAEAVQPGTQVFQNPLENGGKFITPEAGEAFLDHPATKAAAVAGVAIPLLAVLGVAGGGAALTSLGGFLATQGINLAQDKLGGFLDGLFGALGIGPEKVEDIKMKLSQAEKGQDSSLQFDVRNLEQKAKLVKSDFAQRVLTSVKPLTNANLLTK
jgi:hypothetical protein